MCCRIASRLGVLVALLLICPCGGCDNSPPPVTVSYLELVDIYNAELETLDRLKTQKAELTEEYKELRAKLEGKPNRGKRLRDALGRAKESLAENQESLEDLLSASPEELLDKAAAKSGDASQLATQFLDSLAADENEDANQELEPALQAELEKVDQEYEEKRAALDAEIAAQEKRVAQARADRDAARPVP